MPSIHTFNNNNCNNNNMVQWATPRTLTRTTHGLPVDQSKNTKFHNEHFINIWDPNMPRAHSIYIRLFTIYKHIINPKKNVLTQRGMYLPFRWWFSFSRYTNVWFTNVIADRSIHLTSSVNGKLTKTEPHQFDNATVRPHHAWPATSKDASL